MKSFNVKDGKIERELSSCETIYLASDVMNLVNHWIDYFRDKLNNKNEATKSEQYEGAIWALGILKKELN